VGVVYGTPLVGIHLEELCNAADLGLIPGTHMGLNRDVFFFSFFFFLPVRRPPSDPVYSL
jgi:hypothetical protein